MIWAHTNAVPGHSPSGIGCPRVLPIYAGCSGGGSIRQRVLGSYVFGCWQCWPTWACYRRLSYGCCPSFDVLLSVRVSERQPTAVDVDRLPCDELAVLPEQEADSGSDIVGAAPALDDLAFEDV